MQSSGEEWQAGKDDGDESEDSECSLTDSKFKSKRLKSWLRDQTTRTSTRTSTPKTSVSPFRSVSDEDPDSDSGKERSAGTKKQCHVCGKYLSKQTFERCA